MQKTLVILWFQLLKSENLLVLSLLYHRELIFLGVFCNKASEDITLEMVFVKSNKH